MNICTEMFDNNSWKVVNTTLFLVLLVSIIHCKCNCPENMLASFMENQRKCTCGNES